MSKTWQVFKYELINTFSRRSFILTLFLVPLIPAVVIGILSQIGTQKTAEVTQFFTPDKSAILAEGYIDQAHLINDIPPWIEADQLLAFPSELEAQKALQNNQISGYYLIPPDYIDTGEVHNYRKDINPITGFGMSDMFDSVIQFNLLEGDLNLYQQVENPITFQYESTSPQAQPVQEFNTTSFFISYAVAMVFYILVISTSSLMLNNITKEKENRVIEILMSSLDMIKLFTGKILALGLTGVIMLIVWVGSGLFILRIGGTVLNIPASMQLPASLLLWAIVFFLLGFGMYGSLMSGIGAMVSNLREASQATMVVIIPILIPLVMINVLINDPNGTFSIILSLFPLTAPVAMITRISTGLVPIWQPLLSALFLLGSVTLIIRSVAKLFRTQTMLAGQKFSAAVFVKALFIKA